MASCRAFHHHVCPKCFHVWSHHPNDVEDGDAAHKCPTCGKGYHWMAMSADEAALAVEKRDPLAHLADWEKSYARLRGLLDA